MNNRYRALNLTKQSIHYFIDIIEYLTWNAQSCRTLQLLTNKKIFINTSNGA